VNANDAVAPCTRLHPPPSPRPQLLPNAAGSPTIRNRRALHRYTPFRTSTGSNEDARRAEM
jgi:hypothetical protein